jgi:hypothetical protein
VEIVVLRGRAELCANARTAERVGWLLNQAVDRRDGISQCDLEFGTADHVETQHLMRERKGGRQLNGQIGEG